MSNNKSTDDVLFCINFTRWKQNYIKHFLASYGEVVFVASADDAIKKGFNSSSILVTWASKDPVEVSKLIESFSVKPWCVEDGFIRSAGLGSDLTAPASLVLDKLGIYYDPTEVSDLENLLQNKCFSPDELERADALRSSLLENELSKYNVGKAFSKSALMGIKGGQRIFLVPGQVEDDASIKKGCIDINTNTALIEIVRQNNPEAFLIYKPHPDVVSGNRKGKVATEVTDLHCDLVLFDTSITDCLSEVDEVHTMTSLVGFEALLRHLQVVCYGLPFYAGWGLTEDRHQLQRRTRKLKLSELVAATYIHYPLYINWQDSSVGSSSSPHTTPEIVVSQLKVQIELQGGKQRNQVFLGLRVLRKIKNYIRGMFR